MHGHRGMQHVTLLGRWLDTISRGPLHSVALLGHCLIVTVPLFTILLPGRRAGNMSGGSAINGSKCGVKLESLMGGDLSRAFVADAAPETGQAQAKGHRNGKARGDGGQTRRSRV